MQTKREMQNCCPNQQANSRYEMANKQKRKKKKRKKKRSMYGGREGEKQINFLQRRRFVIKTQ